MNTLEERLIYCDDRFAVVNKIPGEMCSFDEGKPDEKFYIPVIFKNSIETYLNRKTECIECVNRVDRPVSGLVLLALQTDSERVLKGLFNSKDKVDKKYWAIVEGLIENTGNTGVLQDYLFFNPGKQKSYICEKEHRKSKYAELIYEIKGKGERYSYIEVQLKTGRTHQIRTQLANKGFHIRGDLKYGAKRSDTIPGIRLHSAYLKFQYPGDKVFSFNAPVLYKDALWNDALNYFEKDYHEDGVTGEDSE